jgi:protein PhnA
LASDPCELCSSPEKGSVYEARGKTAVVCQSCREQIESAGPLDTNHWRGLEENIWTENALVKVLAWRVLTRLSSEGWAQDLLHQLDLESDQLEWAREGQAPAETSAAAEPRDSNGTILKQGDSVILIKDLDVKGAGFTAKRGTLVKNISVTDDPALIEGKVNGTQIVLKTCFLKKST